MFFLILEAMLNPKTLRLIKATILAAKIFEV